MKARYFFATSLMASVSYTAMAADTTCSAIGGSLSGSTCVTDNTYSGTINSNLTVNGDTFTINTSNGSSSLVQVKETAQPTNKIDDTITDASGLTLNGDITLLDGNDTVNLTGSNKNLTINGILNLGADTSGNNVLNINSAVINGYVMGATDSNSVGGNDIVNLTDADIDASSAGGEAINLAGGANVINAEGSSVIGNIITGAGEDTITLGDNNTDETNPNYSSLASNFVGTVITNEGNDEIMLYQNSSIDGSQASLGAIRLESGDDRLDLYQESNIKGRIEGGGGDDYISLHDESTVQGDIFGNVGIDTISIQDNAILTGNINTGADNDVIQIQSATTQGGVPKVIGDVDAGTGDDRLTVSSGGVIEGNVFMRDGVDTVTILSTINGNVDTGAGNDTVRIGGSGLVTGTGLISTGTGEDIILAYLDGQSTGKIDTGADNDTLKIGFEGADTHAAKLNEVDMGDGDDTVIAFSQSEVTKLDTNTGNDKVYLLDETNVGELIVGAGNDIVTLGVTSYAVTDGLLTQEQADQFHTTHTVSLTSLDTGDGMDTVELASETSITGNLLTGNDKDILLVKDNARINGSANMGAGLDEATISNTAIVANMDLGGDDDTLLVQNNAKITGLTKLGAGNDGAIIKDFAEVANLDAGIGDDITTVSDVTTIGAVNMGDGSDELILNGDQITLTGTLDGGDDISEADGFVDRLTFNGWNTSLPNVDYVNWEYMTLENSNFTVDGQKELNVGTLEVKNNSSLKVNTDLPSDVKVNGNLANDGTIDMSNNKVGGGLTVAGDYTGNGTLVMDVNLKDETSDQLVVGGDVQSSGNIDFNRVGGDTAGTKSTQIKVVDAVNDDKNTASTFTFDGTMGGSAKAWKLYDKTDGFYIGYDVDDPIPPIPPVIPPEPEIPVLIEVPALVVVPTVARDLTDSGIRNLHDRLGELRRLEGWVGPNTGEHSLSTHMGKDWSNIYSYIPRDFNVWAKGVMGGSQTEGKDTYAYDGIYGGVDAGADIKLELGSHDITYVGIYGGYRDGSYTTDGTTREQGWANTVDNRNADINISSWHMGAYATYLWRRTSFIDFVVQYADIDADVSTKSFETQNGNAITRYAAYNGTIGGQAFSASAEFGHRVDINDDLILEPQLQLTYTHMNWDDVNRKENAQTLYTASYEDMHYLTTRVGLRLEKTFELSEDSEFKPWLRVSYLQEFGDTSSIKVANDMYNAYDLNAHAEFNIGATYVVSDTIQLSAGVNYRSDFRDYQAYDGNIGVRISW